MGVWCSKRGFCWERFLRILYFLVILRFLHEEGILNSGWQAGSFFIDYRLRIIPGPGLDRDDEVSQGGHLLAVSG